MKNLGYVLFILGFTIYSIGLIFLTLVFSPMFGHATVSQATQSQSLLLGVPSFMAGFFLIIVGMYLLLKKD
ncbi:MAG: hypothetical protein ACXAEF_13825 [Candidatus Thorarchaeota archaeon]|jgi:hypothetical protein